MTLRLIRAHYLHKDSIVNYLANIFGIIYWFNPFVWYALKELRFEREIGIYILTSSLLLGLAPILSTYASETEIYSFDESNKNISYLDLSSEFAGYEGCFVLYDTNADKWSIYNKNAALERISPTSTYKIYDALLGLESGIITPEHSRAAWDGSEYPFDAWESDQDLNSAMKNSVNWYFQKLDTQAGVNSINTFLHKIKYGNQTIGNNLELYWLDSSLKISAIEQVELLKKFYNNEFGFRDSSIDAVKESICLSLLVNLIKFIYLLICQPFSIPCWIYTF